MSLLIAIFESLCPQWRTTVKDPETGMIYDTWTKAGRLHRDDAPAKITWHAPKKGSLPLTVEWYRRGQRHRADGPAIIQWNPSTEAIIDERWYKNDRLHRDDGPAHTLRDAAGRTLSELWLRHGQIHRDGGPAFTVHEPALGSVSRMVWYQNDRVHRDGGPAIIHQNPATGETDEHYYQYGAPAPNWATIGKGKPAPPGPAP
ncbi:hypothetical protein [Arvimicrobium flavum]|uniref:hypothetical protein n=1 Tax=Arvimicrobium flavum TaxID=3393320 RepID=UPI00237B24FA|nr:hypothetical protein [Mesorhizobium shangrilense]